MTPAGSLSASPFVREGREDDHFHDKCGLFGVYGHPEAAHLAYMGLYALQHRGQEAAGICSGDAEGLHLHKALGYVADVFSEAVLDSLPGDAAIGHTRYSTTGGNVASAAHPFLIHGRFGQVALCHNGNLTNTETLRAALIADGHTFTSPSDSEVLLALINRAQADTLEEAVVASTSTATTTSSGIFRWRSLLLLRALAHSLRTIPPAISSTALRRSPSQSRRMCDGCSNSTRGSAGSSMFTLTAATSSMPGVTTRISQPSRQ